VVLVIALIGSGCGVKQSEVLANAARASATAETYKVGFVVLDLTSLGQALGLDFASTGDDQAQIMALTDFINSKGGLGGRPMEAVIRVYEAFGDNKLKEEQLCKAFTQDDGVQAVVLIGQFQSNARPCYAAAKVLMMDATTYPLAQADFDLLAPYLWQPSFPEYGELLAGLVDGLDRSEFFTDATPAVVGIDSPANRRIFDERVKPALAGIGVEPVEVRWIDGSSSATLQAGQDQAVLSFKAKAVDRLVVVGGQRLAAFMMETGKKQQFQPRFALTTWDNPEFAINNYPDQVLGSEGVSVIPAFDQVPESDLPFPSGPGENFCLDVLAKAGQTFKDRQNARVAFLYCDATYLLGRGFAGVTGELTAEAFRDNVWSLGSEYISAATYASSFTRGRYAGGDGYRSIRFDQDCACMSLNGDVVRFPR